MNAAPAISAACNAFVDSLPLSKRRANAAALLSVVSQWFAGFTPDSITANDVVRFQKYRIQAGVSHARINLEIGQFMEALRAGGLLPVKLESVYVPLPIPVQTAPVSSEQYAEVLRAAKQFPRWHVGASYAYIAPECGLTLDEWRTLRMGDVDIRNRKIYLCGLFERTLTITETMMPHVTQCMAHGYSCGSTTPDSFVFPLRIGGGSSNKQRKLRQADTPFKGDPLAGLDERALTYLKYRAEGMGKQAAAKAAGYAATLANRWTFERRIPHLHQAFAAVVAASLKTKNIPPELHGLILSNIREFAFRAEVYANDRPSVTWSARNAFRDVRDKTSLRWLAPCDLAAMYLRRCD